MGLNHDLFTVKTLTIISHLLWLKIEPDGIYNIYDMDALPSSFKCSKPRSTASCQRCSELFKCDNRTWACFIYIEEQGISQWLDTLTLNVRGPSYLALTRSISWLLMPWLLAPPGHQQPWYWLCRIGRFLSYLRKAFQLPVSYHCGQMTQNVNICLCSLWKI